MFNYFIDESGKPYLKLVDASRPHFSLAGVIVHDNAKNNLKIKADQIKFKYWGRTDVCFHAQELRRLDGEYAIFKGPSRFTINEFYDDLINFLNSANYKLGIVCTNKLQFISKRPSLQHAIANAPAPGQNSNWWKQINGTETNLLKKAATELMAMFLFYLNKKKAKAGEVIIESATEIQDMALFSAYNKILISGFVPFSMNTVDVREKLTGISFVTKQNHDIEEELADIASHYFNIEARLNDGLINAYDNARDGDVIKTLKSKLFMYKPSNSSNLESSFKRLS